MQLNSELKEILTNLGSVIPEEVIKDRLDNNLSLILYFKTPNIFYKTYKIYKSDENELVEISDKFSEEDIKVVKSCLTKAYFNYFVHHNTMYSRKYYVVLFEKDPENPNKIIPVDTIQTNKLQV